jgi:outer membrane lipoprotein SlyB
MSRRMTRLILLLPVLLLAAGCQNRYSADEYAQRAVQQANPVQQGVVVGHRRVAITAEGTVGAATGAAAGGAVGAAVGSPGRVASALGAVGGGLVGGLVGTAAERAMASADGIEYVIRKTGNNELVSVTQRDREPIAIGTRVLVIAGAQARVVPDYTVPAEAPAAATPAASPPAEAPQPGVAAAPLAEAAPAPARPQAEALPAIAAVPPPPVVPLLPAP